MLSFKIKIMLLCPKFQFLVAVYDVLTTWRDVKIRIDWTL